MQTTDHLFETEARHIHTNAVLPVELAYSLEEAHLDIHQAGEYQETRSWITPVFHQAFVDGAEMPMEQLRYYFGADFIHRATELVQDRLDEEAAAALEDREELSLSYQLEF